MCLLSINLLWWRVSLDILAHSLLGYLFTYYWILPILYILWICQYFLLTCSLLLILLTVPFKEQKFLILKKYNLSIFSSLDCVWVISTPYLTQAHTDFPLFFSSKSLIVCIKYCQKITKHFINPYSSLTWVQVLLSLPTSSLLFLILLYHFKSLPSISMSTPSQQLCTFSTFSSVSSALDNKH